MADHINITHPDRHEQFLREQLPLAELKARLEVMSMQARSLSSDLSAIFTRIDRGETVELHYPDGEVVIVGAVKP